MINKLLPIISGLLLSSLLQSCSSVTLQSSRLDSAEENITLAERSINNKHMLNAESYLGTATAYLGTIADFIKTLTPNEKIKYSQLKQRESKISKDISSKKQS